MPYIVSIFLAKRAYWKGEGKKVITVKCRIAGSTLEILHLGISNDECHECTPTYEQKAAKYIAQTGMKAAKTAFVCLPLGSV